MKRLLSTLVVFVLLLSAIGIAFNFAPAKSVPTWHLEVSTSPAVVDTYIPGGIGAGQTGDYPVGWAGPITAPSQVFHNVSGYFSTAWNFDHWEENGTGDFNNPVNAPYAPFANPAADDYINLTAVFLTYYYLKVNSPYGLPTIGEGWYAPGSTVNAGLATGSQWVSYGVFWYFDHWSGDASGSNFATSNGILMNSGKTANALWYVQYYLEWHSPEYYDGIFWHNWLGFDGFSWYNNSVVVPLSAPALGETNDNVWQFRFDHWNKNGAFYSNNQNITVTISGAPINMTAYYYEYDYLTFNDNIGGISGVSALTGWYKTGTTVSFTPPAGTPIPNGAGMQLRWAWWDENAVFFSSNMTISYYVFGAKTLTARYQQQYKVTLDTYPTLPTTVQIQGSSVTGTAPINGWFDAGSNLVFWVPDVAVLVPGNYMWQFDTGLNGQWWLNGVFWGAGAGPNGTGWRWAGYNGLNQPLNVKANYTKYYYVSWDTNPTGLSGPNPAWVGSGWFKAGTIVQGGIPPSWYNPVWAFKEIIDNSVSQGVGVSNYYLDSGSLSQSHVLNAHYVNATAFTITPSSILLTAPKYCTNFDVSVVAANFDASRGRDLWALDFKIYYNSTLLKLVAADYAPYLDALWGAGKWFVAKNESSVDPSGWDLYWFAATALQGAHGFQGSATVVKLTFHVELDPCYPKQYWSPISWWSYVLTNSTGYPMYPELAYGANYYISAPQPIAEIVLTNMPIRRNAPQQTFDAYVNIKFGIKVHDFDIYINYPNALIQPVNVTFGDYLPGPAFISRGFYMYSTSVHVWAIEDSSSPMGNGNGTLFIIEFKVINQAFWNNPTLSGMISFDLVNSYLSVRCPFPAIQHFNPDVLTIDAAYNYVPLPGDLNFDGMVDISDLILLAHAYNPGVPIIPGSPYDVNLDGTVNILDLVLVAMHYHDHI
jgi:hypothetical protein